MAVFEATIGSAWTADDTFGYLAVFSNAEQWDPGVLEGEQLDPGPVRIGSRFRLVVPFLGRKIALVYRVTSSRRRPSGRARRGQHLPAGPRPHRRPAGLSGRGYRGQLPGRGHADRTAAPARPGAEPGLPRRRRAGRRRARQRAGRDAEHGRPAVMPSGEEIRSALAGPVDRVLEVSVAGSFSRLGYEVRSRLLPEFTRAPAGSAGWPDRADHRRDLRDRALGGDQAGRSWRQPALPGPQ